MAVSRRSFLRTLGAGGAAVALPLPLIAARGREATVAESWRGASFLPPPEGIRIDSNENPYGPASQVLPAIRDVFGESSRYPDWTNAQLRATAAEFFKVPEDHFLFGSGSSEILKVAVETFASARRGLVTAAPTFELPTERAQDLGIPVNAVPVDAGLRLDLERMAAGAANAGLVFLCNPNNPTGTVHGGSPIRDTIARILRASPDVVVLVDEAYHEFVSDPGYRSMLPLALEEPRVVVSRTFSKVYGMAGLRLGFAVAKPDTLAKMAPHMVANGVSIPAGVAGWASLRAVGHAEREAAKNAEARAFTRRFFEEAGYKVAPSQANFLMVDIRRDIVAFRDACRKRGVMVGRPFPPLTTHLRVSMGTMDEMHRAAEVMREVLNA